jgi:hypothetical protein
MKKGMLISAAITVTLCTVAVTNTARAEQMDVQTADLLRFIEGGSEQASYDATPASASMLEFAGGELQTTAQKGKGCCGSCCPPTWVGGLELLMFRPHIHGQKYQGSIAEVDGVRVDSRDYAMDDMTFSPRIWLGKQGECWGLLGRFWYMEASNMYSDPYLGAANGDYRAATAGNRIKAYTVDVEVNRRLNYCCWQMNLGLGVRGGSLEFGTMASQDVFGDPAIDPDAEFLSSAFTKSRFDGIGLTLGLDGRRMIWPCHNLSAFWAVRGSALWGDASYSGYSSSSVRDAGGSAANVTADYVSSDETMFIGELQLGLLWEHRLKCLPANFFVKVAAEYQYWGLSGADPIWNGALSDTGGGGNFTYPQYDATPPSASLFGLNLGIGLTWGGCCDSYCGKK